MFVKFCSTHGGEQDFSDLPRWAPGFKLEAWSLWAGAGGRLPATSTVECVLGSRKANAIDPRLAGDAGKCLGATGPYALHLHTRPHMITGSSIVGVREFLAARGCKETCGPAGELPVAPCARAKVAAGPLHSAPSLLGLAITSHLRRSGSKTGREGARAGITQLNLFWTASSFRTCGQRR